MADLLELSRKVIEGADEIVGPVNRITHELSEIGDNLAMVESFSHSIIFRTDAGLCVFDTSSTIHGDKVVEALRTWTDAPLHSVVYTHGHIDHVGGSGSFKRDAQEKGNSVQFVAHENVSARMHRYQMTSGHNLVINERQFGAFRNRGYGMTENKNQVAKFLSDDVVWPDVTYRDRTDMVVGDLKLELFHGLGETDDHTWAWIPEQKAICAGDFFIWNFPNCGNPQKVQRYPLEWSQELRKMSALQPELLLPAHGLPIAGTATICRLLDQIATILEQLVEQTLEMMNNGAKLNDIIHSVKVDPALLQLPWLKPFYDEPEFVIHNIWRLYGGWYTGQPDELKPAADSERAKEIASLCGGVNTLIARAQQLSANGNHRVACHLIETAVMAESDNKEVHAARAHIYQTRRDLETSLMAKGIFGTAANESAAAIGDSDTS